MTNQIEQVLYETYGVSLMAAEPTTIIWAAERCAEPTSELKKANRARQRMGKMPAYAPYGSKCF